jgi:hypothetical protein
MAKRQKARLARKQLTPRQVVLAKNVLSGATIIVAFQGLNSQESANVFARSAIC